MLIRSITQNTMDKKFSIRQFPSPEHPYIAVPQKNLAVLDISRFTFCKVDYCTGLLILLKCGEHILWPYLIQSTTPHTQNYVIDRLSEVSDIQNISPGDIENVLKQL